jgi:RNA polymerase sigma factor (sigma-70 family)
MDAVQRRTAHASDPGCANGVGDVGELYLLLGPRLERIVRSSIRGPDALIEDACQFAWSRLLHHQHRVQRETALAWLAKTAFHEAFKLLRQGSRDLSLEFALEIDGEPASIPSRLEPHDCCEQHDRLAALSSLPPRQQRILWLRAVGFSYDEIAARAGCTTRTVERQLTRARANLRAASASL